MENLPRPAKVTHFVTSKVKYLVFILLRTLSRKHGGWGSNPLPRGAHTRLFSTSLPLCFLASHQSNRLFVVPPLRYLLHSLFVVSGSHLWPPRHYPAQNSTRPYRAQMTEILQSLVLSQSYKPSPLSRPDSTRGRAIAPLGNVVFHAAFARLLGPSRADVVH
jgi:hypothetical protein